LPLWYKQNGVCPLSGEVIPIEWATDGDKTNLDHIVPHSKGGTTTMDNVQLTLQEANAAKSDKG
jgi:CRISPR/Cas system Type II protein with McrA/HNH and RuvC-like nuclease domain